jgi:hypothetical protein
VSDKIRIGKAGIYDPKTKTFDFPTPRDPDYFVSLDSLQGHEALLLEVCHWREKGVSSRQIVELLEEGAAALS